MNARAVIALGLVAGIVAAVFVLAQPPKGMPAPRTTTVAARPAGPRETPFVLASECSGCHQPVWNEWMGSYHQMAWTDPMVQALSQGFRMEECIDCHAPLPIHVTGVGVRVSPRNHQRSDGVDCLTCHLMDDGVSVAATRTVDTSATPGACRPVAVETLPKVDTCAGCHNQHETVSELLESGVGKSCSDCHMESVSRPGGRTGRSHVFPGGHSVEMHRRATKLEAKVEDGRVVATVTNVGAGHKIPTDARHRSYNLWISTWDERGNAQVKDQPIPDGEMRLYYRDQFKPSTQVAHGKSHVASWRIPEGLRGRAVVRLTYALNPEELGKGIVTEVATAEVEIR